MTAEQLDRHPAGRWSTAEVLEHLYLSYTGTVKGFERCLESGKPLASSPTLKHRLMTAVVTGVGYLPSGRKAPKQTQPKGTPKEKVVQDIGPQISRMDELIAKCEARHGERVLGVGADGRIEFGNRRAAPDNRTSGQVGCLLNPTAG